MLWLLALAPVAFGLGWALGRGMGREHYAKEVGEQNQRIVGLAGRIRQLEGEIEALISPVPDHDTVVRVLESVAAGTDSD